MPAGRPCTLSEFAAERSDLSGDKAGLLAVGFNARLVACHAQSISSLTNDTSAWMFSLLNVFSWRRAGTGQSHEMPTIFRRLSTISRMLLHPYFVFDGPDCPQIKRGKDVGGWSPPSLLVQRFQELLTAFGFDWHVAPGEAEAELSCLQSCGFIDAVVTPYNDTLLFGATCVLRSIRGDEDVEVYSAEAIENSAALEWGDLLLITLMSSADSDTGCRWCDTDVARRLVDYGFGRTLLEAAISLQFVEFMEFVAKWRDNVCEVLRTDPQHFLGRRYHELARIIKEERFEFPDPAILAMYLSPLTSWSDDGHSPITCVTSRQPNLTALAAFCSQRLGWPPDTVQSALMDACAGAAMRALLQVSFAIMPNMPIPSHHSPYAAAGQRRW
ncbi:PIN domain-like protein [Pisolithus tinctorius]|uniref:XPG-I domain-containing protein n=1 Tax=Pisolithus tinctorius Marx 270 TaxID=870435 RepID=A0A0C3P7M9_PISTI|nr:PIN domain-like protein [Pisolithus tinctorius]KIO03439.1 hypothetical protein M404DRAFT_145575 [Pisolithus tinctorius Marx 270]